MKKLFYFFSILCLALAPYSCKKNTTPPQDLGHTYYPNSVGSFIVYDVDSTIYRDFFGDTLYHKCQLKEKIASTFLDNSNRQALRIERFFRDFDSTQPYDSLPWILKDVWHAIRTNTELEKVEENVKYVRLSFPPRKGQSWDGNSYNTNAQEFYIIERTDFPQTYGSLSFDSTLKVVQRDETNLIERKYGEEHYAKRVGLIYKHEFDYFSNTIDPQLTPVVNRIEGGFEVKMTISSFGTE